MDRRREQEAMRDWVVAEGYDTFCTLKFKNGYDIDERQAERVVQLFLQRVDKAYWGNRRALLHKSGAERSSPFPGRTYPTATVTGMPSAV